MRPLRIEFQAFGPYPERVEVDFTALAHRGLFVVAGDTGTGKTTLLDAMSFALYGTMPLKEAGEIRSHHADLDDRTEVRLTFQVGDETYVVERAPTQVRRGRTAVADRVTERAKVTLSRVVDGSTEPIANGVREADHRIQELVGLSATQFQRVVLLPQAKVTDFLLAGSGDREALLEQLFDGRVFDGVVEGLRRRRDAATQSVGAVDEQLRNLVASAESELHTAEELLAAGDASDEVDPREPASGTEPDQAEPPEGTDGADVESLQQRLAVATTALARLREDARAATESAGELATQLARAEELVSRFDRAKEFRAELDSLRADEPRVAEAAQAAESSARARPVVEAVAALVATREQLTAAIQEEERVVESARAHLLALGLEDAVVDPAAFRDELARLEEEHRVQVDRLGAAQRLRAEVTDLEQRLVTLQQSITEQTDLAQSTASTVAELERRIDEVSTRALDAGELAGRTAAARAAVDARRKLDEALVEESRASEDHVEQGQRHARLLQQYLATQVPQLAANLIDGEPCPVCGSVEHPSPGTDTAVEPVDLDQVDAAAALRDAAEVSRARAAQTVVELRLQLGERESVSEADLARAVTEAEEAEAAAGRARDDLQQLTAQREQLVLERDEARTGAAGLEGQREQAAQELDRRGEELRAADDQASGIDPDQVTARGSQLQSLRQLVAPLQAATATRTRTDGAVAQAQRTAAAALESSPFESEPEAGAALLDLDDELARLEERTKLNERIQEVAGALEALEQLDIPDEPPDVEALSTAAASAESRARSLNQRQTMVEAAVDRAGDHLTAHEHTSVQSGSARAELELVTRAHEICAKGGSLRFSLKRWVLAQELERVTLAANEHLRSMTNGRYALRVKRQVTDARTAHGLELEVFDAETGRARGTPSLSGGEQFQASLALALGLADVVSQGGVASGHRFEALFVDEGFGALDPDSLDDAIETLQALHATGRTIGVITHVEAMKERLHVGIQVERRPDGRGSRLTVLP